MRPLLTIPAFVLAAALTGCGKDCEPQHHPVLMPMTVSPAAERIRLGDTLWVEVILPYQNVDTRNGEALNLQRVDVSGFNVDMRNITKLGNTLQAEGQSAFHYWVEAGQQTTITNVALRCAFAKQPDRYFFRLGIVPQKIGLVNLVSYRAIGEQGKCTSYAFSPVNATVPNGHTLYLDLQNLPHSTPMDTYFNQHFVWVE